MGEDGAARERGDRSGTGRVVRADVAGPQCEAGAGGDCSGGAGYGTNRRTSGRNDRRNNAEGRSADCGND